MKNFPCPSCHSIDTSCIGMIPDAIYFAGQSLQKPISGGSLYRCKACNLHFRFPHLDKQEFDDLYKQGREEQWQSTLKERQDWIVVCKWIREALPNGSILDVGCFDGGLLEYIGEPYNREGIEIHPGAVQRVQERGFQVVGSDYTCLNKLEKSYDVVIAIDVIEHVSDPSYFLKMLSTVTRPGGIIIISTGNTNAISWRVMGARYWYCTIAEHISFINPRWCKKAATDIGLSIEKTEFFCHRKESWTKRVFNTLKNICYRVTPDIYRRVFRKESNQADKTMRLAVKNYPPSWLTASDHFLTLFKKQ